MAFFLKGHRQIEARGEKKTFKIFSVFAPADHNDVSGNFSVIIMFSCLEKIISFHLLPCLGCIQTTEEADLADDTAETMKMTQEILH